MKNVYDNVKILASLVPATRTASANGTGVDTLGYTSVMAVILAGDIDLASTDETYAFKVQDSADNSTFADVTGATTTATADNDVKVVRCDGLRRYVRVVATLGGTTPSWPGSAIFALGRAFSKPVN
ncbi:MAG: hypothetical protein M3P98_01540 [bacterium]|nr:hypothetical protein [bacterium]